MAGDFLSAQPVPGFPVCCHLTRKISRGDTILLHSVIQGSSGFQCLMELCTIRVAGIMPHAASLFEVACCLLKPLNQSSYNVVVLVDYLLICAHWFSPFTRNMVEDFLRLLLQSHLGKP